MMKYLDKLLEFIKPIISSGQTRFLVATFSIIAEVYMSRVCPDTIGVKIAMVSVAVIAITFIVAKTMYNYYKVT